MALLKVKTAFLTVLPLTHFHPVLAPGSGSQRGKVARQKDVALKVQIKRSAEYIGQVIALWVRCSCSHSCQMPVSDFPPPVKAIQEARLKSQHQPQGGPVPAVFGVAMGTSVIFLRIFFFIDNVQFPMCEVILSLRMVGD